MNNDERIDRALEWQREKDRTRSAAIAFAIESGIAYAILTIATIASSAPIGYSIAALSMLAISTIAAATMVALRVRDRLEDRAIDRAFAARREAIRRERSR